MLASFACCLRISNIDFNVKVLGTSLMYKHSRIGM